ncbi:MAG TPA: hypothetical protein VH061_02855 [Solirubrobacteraceae bacterium]|jgi:hypothetical protein|nr:hypothetical protein [Solirubrobacteraceae bacterium]
MGSRPVASPLVCMYLFLEDGGTTVPPHPSPRTRSAVRYLECALVQAASLRLGDAACDLAIVVNEPALDIPVRAARAIWARLDEFGVRRIESDLRVGSGGAAASRFPREAIRAMAAAETAERTAWVPNLDCVWVDPARVLGSLPSPGAVGCLPIGYPSDWSVGGSALAGRSRIELGRTAARLGAAAASEAPPWIGADLLAGEVGALQAMMESCDRLEARLPQDGEPAGNEQLLTLAGALGEMHVADLSAVAARIQTGARHGAGTPAGVESLGLWHLPAEKGLSIRRVARAILGGREAALRADLAEPRRAMRRFNVGTPSRAHQLRDDAWVLAQRPRGR